MAVSAFSGLHYQLGYRRFCFHTATLDRDDNLSCGIEKSGRRIFETRAAPGLMGEARVSSS